jgi:hypothetical protein
MTVYGSLPISVAGIQIDGIDSGVPGRECDGVLARETALGQLL